MKNKSNPRKFVFAAIATFVFLFAASSLATAQAKYKVGDRVECKSGGGTNWEKGTVLPFLENDMYNGNRPESGYFYRVKLDGSTMERPIACFPEKMRLLANADKGNNGDNNKNADTPNPVAAQKHDPEQAPTQFKVGDRVMASPLSMDGEKYWWKCTVTGTDGLKSNFYNIRCDPQGGVSYKDYHVQPKWVRAWPDAEAAPKLDCSFDTPAGAASNTAPASAQLFQRVIYDRMDALEKAKLGLTFTTFQMGTTYKNILTRNGLMDTAAPQNAMIYPVKTQYTTCKEVTGDYNNRVVTKANFACFKDRFGDWVCGADSVPEFLDHQSVPKDQK